MIFLSAQILPEPIGEEHSQSHFYQVWDNERENTPTKRSPKSDRTALAGVDLNKPGGSKSIADEKAEYHCRDTHSELETEKLLCSPVNEPDENEAEDIAAGGAQQRTDSSIETGEHGKPDSAQKILHQNRDRAPLATQ